MKTRKGKAGEEEEDVLEGINAHTEEDHWRILVDFQEWDYSLTEVVPWYLYLT